MRKNLLLLIFALCFSVVEPSHILGQTEKQYDKKSDPTVNRRDGINMLKQINKIVKEYYYDPKFRGIDIEASFKAAEEKIKTQEFRWQIHRTIAQVLLDFRDSHTSFIPPDRLFRVEYGFSMMMIGNSCFVTDVKKGSDAQKKGLRPGDRIVGFSGMEPNRDNFNVITYLIYTLDPQETLNLKLVTGENRQTEINVTARFMSPDERKAERAKRKKDEQSQPIKCVAFNSDVIACKLRTFSIDTETIDKMMKEVAPHKKLILDLRGNGGGYVDTEVYLTGYFFDRIVKIGTEVNRNKEKVRTTKERKNPYGGDLFVLVDSESASAAEIFARIIQLEGRGKIIGDTSMGAVMTSYSLGVAVEARTATVDFKAYRVFGVNITIGDLIMSDGKRLEGVGVTPDHSVGPTPLALSDRSDPVLAFAFELAGSPITSQKAGEFHFLIPKSEEENDTDAEDSKGK